MFKFDPSIIASNDPAKNVNWANYCKHKYNIAKDIQPDIIVEIGVRAGYSAWALLQANPTAAYCGFDCDADVPCSRGGPWSPIAEEMLKSRGYNVKIWHNFDSQKNSRLPVRPEVSDIILYHIDGEHTVKGVYNDLELCFKNGYSGCYILVDDYNAGPSLVVKQGTDKWIADHKNLIETKHFPESANGDMLIKIL